ncbi:MAG TPA: CopG family antitoxin [Pyrinomonadaceae bacterium]|nr:CopG family antitoxin [Pyrinomonadaceae bacterium]
MTNARSKRTKARDPLPEHFDTVEEAAEFWDTHSTADYEEYFKEVDCQFDIKKRTHLISIDGAVYDRIRAIAKKKGIPADKLVSRWIKEKLRSAA